MIENLKSCRTQFTPRRLKEVSIFKWNEKFDKNESPKLNEFQILWMCLRYSSLLHWKAKLKLPQWHHFLEKDRSSRIAKIFVEQQKTFLDLQKSFIEKVQRSDSNWRGIILKISMAPRKFQASSALVSNVHLASEPSLISWRQDRRNNLLCLLQKTLALALTFA
jgi:hypothetical protein